MGRVFCYVKPTKYQYSQGCGFAVFLIGLAAVHLFTPVWSELTSSNVWGHPGSNHQQSQRESIEILWGILRHEMHLAGDSHREVSQLSKPKLWAPRATFRHISYWTLKNISSGPQGMPYTDFLLNCWEYKLSASSARTYVDSYALSLQARFP